MRQHVRKSLLLAIAALLIWTAVGAAKAEAFGVGSRGPDVYAAQGMLKSLGYYSGTIDGIYGPIMAAGVREFQQKYGLPVTGAIDGKTLQSILWAYGELKIPKQAPPKPPAPPSQPKAPSLSAEEQQMVNLVNQERTKRGIAPLKVDPALARMARIKSGDMVANHYFSHQSPTYGSPFDMMRKFGISFTSAGENIACNQSVAAAHQALMNSQGHRENILNSDYDYIGVGIVDGGTCGKMFTQDFVGR